MQHATSSTFEADADWMLLSEPEYDAAQAVAESPPPQLAHMGGAVGAWLGHDGFQWPGSGDYFHQLHHAHFDCNYGAMHVPIDKWLGTYAGCKEDLKAIWGKLAADRAKVGKDGTKRA